MSISSFGQSATIRWVLTLSWTVLSVSLLLSPSGNGTTVSWISKLFGGTETTDAIGHVIINAILALLWCWTLHLYATTKRTITVVLVTGLIWCVGAELTQLAVPGRGTSLLDLGANILGILLGLAVFGTFAAAQTTTQNVSSVK